MKAKPTKRPANVISNAVHVMRVLTGQDEDVTPAPKPEKNAAAVALGSMGGKARAASTSKKKRSEIARKAAASRWAKN
jgi:hypothetical protein